MACTAVWNLGQDEPRVLSGIVRPGLPQQWTIQAVAETVSGVRERWTIRPRGKVALLDIAEIVTEHAAALCKEHGPFAFMHWTAISR